jgi:hypothetical protein
LRAARERRPGAAGPDPAALPLRRAVDLIPPLPDAQPVLRMEVRKKAS